jgi:GNAT superfamily N-acetyltransferase
MIEPYRPEWRSDFERLNREWIEKYFALETADEEVFKDPEKCIIEKGGQVFFAVLDGVPVGTVGLKPIGNNRMELVKMAVTRDHQGKGYARALCEHALMYAKSLGVQSVVLYTNSILAPAIQLYTDLGFVHVPPEESLFVRANVKMELYYGEVS